MPVTKSTVEYRPIPNFPGYCVGDDGSVWSCKTGGDTNRRGPWRQLKTRANKHGGHLQIVLMPGRVMRYVHQLVLELFVGPRPEGMEARHFPDNNPANNRSSNLSWATPLTNQRDRQANKTDTKGSRHGKAKLTEEIVRKIRSEYVRYKVTSKMLGKKYGVAHSTVEGVLEGKTWKHVS
jgi:hypothetical protein